MKKILFLSASDLILENSGGRQVSKRNYEMLKKYGEVDLVYLSREIENEEIVENKYVFKSTKNKIQTFISNCLLYSGYLTFSSEKKILKLINEKKYDLIFVDTSNYGRIVEKIKKNMPNIKIITFFHNLEYDYVKERIKVEGKLYLPQLVSSYYNESRAVKFSDKLITLNFRDAKRLFEKYKRESDLLLPVSFKDKYKEVNNKILNQNHEKIYLFVGSLFYANYSGIKWFIDKVMPYVSGKLIIVGKDFESKRKDLERKNVEVIGTVEELSNYYDMADIVVAPIFEGAGMKVKTAEALMYGKKILGTQEAFEGYEIDEHRDVFILCKTSDDFIKELNNISGDKFNKIARRIYIDNYSFENSVLKIKKIME